MLKNGSKILVFLLLVSFAFSCKYNKLLKSTDFDLKYRMAVEYYQKKEYNKAFPLFEELLTLYKGTSKAEDIYYYYAYTNYHMGDYILASYHFNNFAKTFPSSTRAQECSFMNAYCYYLDSPEASLDPTNTFKAIDELQLFINKYPQSDSLDRCNILIDDLRGKLEEKSYKSAMLYFKTEDYRAAIVGFKNTLKEFPDIAKREELNFMIVKANYLLAVNSIESKKEERLKSTSEAYINFIDTDPQSQYLKEAEEIYTNTQKALKKKTTERSGLIDS